MIGFGGIIKKIKDSVGALRDRVGVPYVFGSNSLMAHSNTMYWHIHGESFVYPKYADPILLTSSAESWSETGSIIEIIPAGTMQKAFDLHWASLVAISADLFGIVDIYSGPPGHEVKIGEVDVNRTVNFSREGVAPVQIPQQPAKTRISCKFSDSTTSSRTVRLKFYGHFYG